MRLVEESVKRSLKESTKTCETVEDIEDLWYQIATRAKSHLHAEIAGLNIVEENLDPKSVADPNPLAETRAEVVDGDLFVDIHVDPVFYDLKPDWHVAVLAHPIGRADDLYRPYGKLLSREDTTDDQKKKANPVYSNGGHDLDWKSVTTDNALTCGIKAAMALLTVIDFTDNKFFQTNL